MGVMISFTIDLYGYFLVFTFQSKINGTSIAINICDLILKKQILSLIRAKGITEQLDKEIFGDATQASLLLDLFCQFDSTPQPSLTSLSRSLSRKAPFSSTFCFPSFSLVNNWNSNEPLPIIAENLPLMIGKPIGGISTYRKLGWCPKTLSSHELTFLQPQRRQPP